MALEEVIAANTAAVNANSELLKQMLAGRAEAIAKLSGAAETGAAKPGRKPKADTTAAASTAPAASAAPAKTAAPELTDEAIRNIVGGWLKATDDQAERAKRSDFLKSMLAHFGTKQLVGPDGIKDAEQRKQVVFFVERMKANLTVDFNAEYDFDGDPKQDAGSSDDMLG